MFVTGHGTVIITIPDLLNDNSNYKGIINSTLAKSVDKYILCLDHDNMKIEK